MVTTYIEAVKMVNVITFYFSEKPAMPSNVLSLIQLRTMPLADQVKTLLTNGKFYEIYTWINRIGGVMVCVLASSIVDGWFEPRSGQTKEMVFSASL